MSMLPYYQDFLAFLHSSNLRTWAERLSNDIETTLNEQRYGDLPAWQNALETLPIIKPGHIDLTSSVTVGSSADSSKDDHQQLKQCLEALIPWRKGPFSIFDINIDTEWRSDWKWQRILPHIHSLKGQQVLDIGCGNGYHCLRMLGEQASRVVGVDPSPRFIIQFLMLKHYLGNIPVDVLPIGIESLPDNLQLFDTTFSMGVLYHRRSPMDHLRELKATLRPNGQLVLETLIIEGELGECLVPEGRYAMMRNVWFIPSAPTLISWLKKSGFNNPRLVDKNVTSLEEQRSTEWMKFQSLQDFLDPENPNLTYEGHPAPIRGVFIAEAS